MAWLIYKPTEERFDNGLMALAGYECDHCQCRSPIISINADTPCTSEDDLRDYMTYLINVMVPAKLGKLGWHRGDKYLCPKCAAN